MEPAYTQYKSWLSGIFNRSAGQYGQVGPRFFEYFGQTLSDQADIGGDENVLDLACGRGSSLIPAGARLRAPGMAVGIDFAWEMLAALREEPGGVAHLVRKLSQMDAMNLGFVDGVFDVVQCGLALFFLPDLALALAEARRVLKPGGRFVTSTFGDNDERWDPVWDRARSFGDRLAEVPSVQPRRLETSEEIVEVFSAAGFSEIEVLSISKDFYFKDELDWWQTMWSHGGRGLLERMDAAILADFQEQAFEVLQGFRDDQGIPERFNLLITRARKSV